mmetsp:Transcript_5814/g.14941  ORF Transcript_5814/g.14941 Transcript_5814/m.14941 type:complete len:155 (+) Transcript_5814:40-504(+)
MSKGGIFNLLTGTKKGVELEELKQILEEPQPVMNVDNKRGGGGSANEMDEARTINRENESQSSASSTLNFDTVRESISKVTQVPSTTVAGAAIGAITGGIIAGPLGAAAGVKSGAACVAASAGAGAAIERVYTCGQEAVSDLSSRVFGRDKKDE